MAKLIDLHTHTTASDGSLTPSELVIEAKNKGLAAVAITDHDTAAGVEQAVEAGERAGIEVVPGVEISVESNGEMHILGYYFDYKSGGMQAFLNNLIDARDERNPKIILKLQELGMNITMEDVLAEAGEGTVGRPHIAKALMKKGYVKSIDDAFNKYLGDGARAFVKKDKLTPAQGIQAILENGGIPVLAHPKYLSEKSKKLEQLIGELKDYGLMGIEAYYTTHTTIETANYLRMAIKYDLLVTGGSDFHGSTKPTIELGRGAGHLKVDYGLLEKMKNRKGIL